MQEEQKDNILSNDLDYIRHYLIVMAERLGQSFSAKRILIFIDHLKDLPIVEWVSSEEDLGVGSAELKRLVSLIHQNLVKYKLPIIFPSFNIDSAYVDVVNELSNISYQNFMIMPVIVGQKVSGFIAILGKDQGSLIDNMGGEWGAKDAEILSRLSDKISKIVNNFEASMSSELVIEGEEGIEEQPDEDLPSARKLLDLSYQLATVNKIELASETILKFIKDSYSLSAANYLYLDQSGEELVRLSSSEGYPALNELDDKLLELGKVVSQSISPLYIEDTLNDFRTKDYFVKFNIKSIFVLPISFQDKLLGLAVVVSEKTQAISPIVSFQLADIVQIAGYTFKQFGLLSAYRKQAREISTLYLLTSRISKASSLNELFEISLKTIAEELGFSHIWLGLLNESKTRISNQIVYGSGWKKRQSQISYEIMSKNNPFYEVISSKNPIMLSDLDQYFKIFGLRNIFSNLEVNSICLLPMISGDVVEGVVAVEINPDTVTYDFSKDGFFANLINEVAAVAKTKKLENQLAESDKMKTAGLLAAGIAHNFNNLLQAIMGQATLLELQQSNPEQIKKSADNILNAARKGAALVRQLSAVADLEDTKIELVDVNYVLEKNLNSYVKLIKDQQRLTLKLTEEIPAAYVDSSQLLRIISSLVSNASEASLDEQEIIIETEFVRVDRNSGMFDVPFGSYVRISIIDFGTGMDDEVRKRCFEPFFTTKEVDKATGIGSKGSGLSLSAVYSLVRKNKGRITVQSRVGHGSTFMLYLRADG